MEAMSDTTTPTAHRDVRVTFRLDRDGASRLDELAAYSGVGRSQFMRLAIGVAESLMTLDEVHPLEAQGHAAGEAARLRDVARARLTHAMGRLRPEPLVKPVRN